MEFNQVGRTVRAAEHEHLAVIAERKVLCATKGTVEYKAQFRRLFAMRVCNSPALANAVRGHMPPIEVSRPDFKKAVEHIASESNGRADPKRASMTIYLGKSTYSTIATMLQSSEVMETVGSQPMQVHRSTICKHRVAARINWKRKRDDLGVLDISARKCAKLLMPTESEQPNGHLMNRMTKELRSWSTGNAAMVNEDGRDDHANLSMDILYNKGTLLQAQVDRKQSAKPSAWQAGQGMAKADTHDYPTAKGSKVVIATHHLHHRGYRSAQRELEQHDAFANSDQTANSTQQVRE
jgi:hypothetical protein